ncbi:hypothetical protein R3P38DRAFT_3177253 [Favolaschia claudopus]|uniref:Uncharacterized protein n=1 Tax=Favolaschia claudopus TaxID=2862362 RepID=A0AAW0D123_9AGAR
MSTNYNDTPSDSSPFPIAAAVAAGMVFFLICGIILVFSLTQHRPRRTRKPIRPSSLETDVEAQPANSHRSAVNQKLKLTISGLPERDELRSARADGSTIYVSSPSQAGDVRASSEGR